MGRGYGIRSFKRNQEPRLKSRGFFVNMKEKEIYFEFWNNCGSSVGTKMIEGRMLPTVKGLSLVKVLSRLSLEPAERQSLVFHLDNNSPKKTGKLCLERGVSAYYFISEEGVTVQWGKINSFNQNAKVHDYLNQQGSGIEGLRRSGHLSLAYFDETSFFLAKVDSLSCQSQGRGGFLIGKNLILVNRSPEGFMARSFLGNGIALLSSDGYFVLSPEYNRALFRLKRGWDLL
ncbi:hypothetical protein C4578_00905 [Candidatus Microgenomates bacterium]|nr:MAG: hypothetical protein C4578_00905 [Candidatus Microgenomates bacterium]